MKDVVARQNNNFLAFYEVYEANSTAGNRGKR
jgi:hypothetical protein